jgi:hypothetical protein
LLDFGKCRAVFGRELLAALRKPRNRGFTDVVGRCLDELGLLGLTPPLAARQFEVGQRQIGLEPLDGGAEGLARDAHGLRLRPQALQPAAEGRVRRRAGGLGQCKHGCAYASNHKSKSLKSHESPVGFVAPEHCNKWESWALAYSGELRQKSEYPEERR